MFAATSSTNTTGMTNIAAAPAHRNTVTLNPVAGDEGAYDDAFAVPASDAHREATEGADAHVIACSTTPGSMRRAHWRRAGGGIGERFHLASLLAHRFAVVTTLTRSVPVLENNLCATGSNGAARACARPMCRCWSSTIRPRMRVPHRRGDIARAGRRSCRGDRARLRRHGGPAASLSAEFGVPVIDGVAAAVVLAEGLAALGLKTSKRGGYAQPLAKNYSGIFAPFSPKASAPAQIERRGNSAARSSAGISIVPGVGRNPESARGGASRPRRHHRIGRVAVPSGCSRDRRSRRASACSRCR